MVLLVHCFITKIGLVYVENLVLREGSDDLLNNLEQGVIIVE